MTTVDVDMDGVWRQAMTSDRLVTVGVATCVAVVLADDATGQAWMIHAPTFGHDTTALESMLAEAKDRCHSEKIRIWTFGAAGIELDDDDDDDDNDEFDWNEGLQDEANRAIEAKLNSIRVYFDGTTPVCCWGKAVNLSVEFKDGAWVCEATAAQTSV